MLIGTYETQWQVGEWRKKASPCEPVIAGSSTEVCGEATHEWRMGMRSAMCDIASETNDTYSRRMRPCLHTYICLSSRTHTGRNVVEGFRTQIIQKKLLGSSPVHQVGNCSFLHVKSDNVFVVLVCQVRCSEEETQRSGVPMSWLLVRSPRYVCGISLQDVTRDSLFCVCSRDLRY